MKTYRVCSGTTSIDIPTVFSDGACVFDDSYWDNNYNNEIWVTPLYLSITGGTPIGFWYNYKATYYVYTNGGITDIFTNILATYISGGTFGSLWFPRCRTEIAKPNGDIVVTIIDYEEWYQVDVPVCYVDPLCDLDLLTATPAAPSIRGENDGTIACTYSGATGATVSVYLNGIFVDDYGTGFTLTGLTSGTYNVRIVEGSCEDIISNIVIPEGEFKTGDFIVSIPNPIVAVENPIIIQIGTATSSLSPQYSINTIVVSGATISGITITFNLDFPQIYTAVFKSKGYPDRSTYFLESVLTDEIGTPVGSNTNTDIALSLAESLQGDSIISRLYYITNSGTTITMQSKEYNDRYNLTSSNVTIVGSGITLTNTQSGVIQYDGQLSSDYSLYCELFINTDLQFGATPVLGDFRRVAELELPYNKNNIHTFDLSTTLKNFVNSPKIDFTFTGFTTIPAMDGIYFVKYGEKYPLIENTNTKKKRYKGITNTLYVLNSALNFEDENDMSVYLGNPITTGSTTYTGVTFMNTAPNPKYIPRGSKEFLYILLKQNYPNALDLRGNIYFYNGTSTTGVTFFNISSITGATNFGGVTLLACGYDELGLAAYENSGNTKIRKVDFAVWQTPATGATTQLTETRSYLFEIDEQPSKFDVAFLNKLGTYETYSFVGEVVEDQTVDRLTYQSYYPVSSLGQAQNGFLFNGVYNTQYTKTWTVNSGTVDADTYYFIMEMLASNKLYNYSNTHENFLTIVSQQAQKSTNSAEFTVQVQFKETIYENNVEK